MTEPSLTQTSRRRGHRSQELLLTVRRSSLSVLGLVVVTLFVAVYFFGHRRGYEEAISDEENRLGDFVATQKRHVHPRESRDFLVVPISRPAETTTKSATVTAAAFTPLPGASLTPKPKLKVVPASKRTARKGFYGIQLGAFKTKAEAQRFINKHIDFLDELPVFLIDVKLRKRGTWTRVRVGEFATKKAAANVKKKLPAKLERGSILVSYR